MSEPKILLVGAPGAGKGTQSENVAEAFDVDHVTTGDALRANKDVETPYGTPREYMDAGELVPDEVVNEIVKEALTGIDGFVLDGYPRNLSQAEYLGEITSLDAVIYLDVSEEELLTRLTGRRVCADCGANFHLTYAPPEEDGVCDDCGGSLYQREDDTEDVAKERIRVYRENTEPVIQFYDDRGDLVRIDGERAPEAVWEDLRETIDRER